MSPPVATCATTIAAAVVSSIRSSRYGRVRGFLAHREEIRRARLPFEGTRDARVDRVHHFTSGVDLGPVVEEALRADGPGHIPQGF